MDDLLAPIPWLSKPQALFVVRLYDGFDHEWMDITPPMSRAAAQRVWNARTNNGTIKTHFNDIDYYAIYPAETTMMFSEQGVYGEHPEYRRD